MDVAAAIELRAVTKRFGSVEAVRDASFAIGEGEFFSMLGPSGCGKTTTLRMVAGFERPTTGIVRLRGEDVSRVEPNRREVNTVFQQYALFPHMNVADNVGFGLKLDGVDRGERRRRVDEMLELVGLHGMSRRRPKQLSGGQQQRVALARALIKRPAALLLDEPLGALDVKLRERMQTELKRIQAELGTTFVYVTHDQDEALGMSDRIAVMNAGRVEQVGSPREIYEQPTTAFVADFIGAANVLDVRVDQRHERTAVMRVAGGELWFETPEVGGASPRVLVRPERVRILPPSDLERAEATRLRGRVVDALYLGETSHVRVAVEGIGTLLCHQPVGPGHELPDRGMLVGLTWEPTDARALPAERPAATAPPAVEAPARSTVAPIAQDSA